MKPVNFSAVKNSAGNREWQTQFYACWPAYKQWYLSKTQGRIQARELVRAQNALKSTMPEIMPIYDQLCEFANDDPVAMQFLTLYQPPAYLINCSQAVFFDEQPMLIRNYDLSPELSENTILFTHWQDREVIATNECLWGADDGMNDAGLAVSLTFGGRREVGRGFGIPLILRYVLQTCENVKQAITQLERIPSHMAYNVTAVDRGGDFATVMLAADQQAIVTRQGVATNHQQNILWHEQAGFTKTLERKRHLESVLDTPGLNEPQLINAFHRPPLYSTNYQQNFGTVYTAVYKPACSTMAYHWPGEQWQHSFAAFNEGVKTIRLGKSIFEASALKDVAYPTPLLNASTAEQSNMNHDWSKECYVSDYIPESMMSQFETIFSYLPEDYIPNSAAYQKLKSDLNNKQQMSWSQFSTSMQQLWM